MGIEISKQKPLKGFLPKVDAWLSWAVERIGLNTAVFYHLAITMILFSPFLMFGKPLIASTDNIIHMFPNFIFSHRAFNNGELGLWNPYVYCGINFSGSPQNFIYYPVNWLIFIFPEKFVYLLMTCRMFFETWFVGIFAFLFFSEELQDKKWALFTSTVYQLCGYMFFSITAYAGLTIYALMTVSIYLIFTLHKRRRWLSFLGIAACVAGIFLCNNPLYGLATLFHLGILMVYRYFSFNFKQPTRWKDFRLLVLSFTTGMLINMIYLLPFMNSLLTVGTTVGSKSLDTLRGSIYFGLTAFVPEVMAISYKTSFPWLQTLLGRMDMHSQNHAYTYFGGLSIILLLWAVISLRKLKIGFWLSYLFLATCWYLRISPVSDVLNVLFFPFVHEIVPLMMIPLPFCVIVGHAAKQLGENPASSDKKSLQTIVILLIVTVLSMLAFLALSHSQYIKEIQMVSMVMILLALGSVLLLIYKKKAVQVCRPYIPMIGAVGSVFVFFSAVSGVGGSLNNLGVVYAAISLLGISVLWILVEVFSGTGYSKGNFLYIFLAVCAVYVLAWLYMQNSLLPRLAQPGFSLLFLFGLLRLAFVTAFFVVVLGKAQAGSLNKKYFYLCLLSLILVDLIPYNKVYSHMVMDPFTKEDFYPNQKKFFSDRGLKHYRVNVPNVYVERLKEPRYYSNAHIVYGIRSFGGVNADVPQRHQHFSDTLHPAPGEKPDIFKHQRFLALNGTHYDITIDGERFTRSDALSRFMLYKDFDIIKEDAGTIIRLYDSEFKPLKKVVLNKSPGILPSKSDQLAERLEYTEIKTSVLECKVRTESAALVFLGDSYHKDWKAFVNGKESPVIRANYKFMATPIPAGESKVVFKFQPQMFQVGKNLTLIGLFLLVLFSLVGIIRDLKRPSAN